MFLPLLVSVLAVYLSITRNDEMTLVSVRDTVTKAVMEVPCSHDYDNEDFHGRNLIRLIYF